MKTIIRIFFAVCLALTGAMGAQLVKSANGLAIASVKTADSLAIASVKTMDGLDNTSAAAPTFVAELTSDRETSVDNSATTVHTLAGSISATHTMCVFIGWISATQTVSSVADSKGNSYTVHTASAAWDGSNGKLCWATGYATTALVATDTVTVTWGSPAFTYRVLAFFDVSGAASAGQPDQQTTAIGTDGFPVATASTTATNTCLIGVVGVGSQARTLNSAAWTIIGAVQDWPDGTDRSYYVYKNATSSGSQNPDGVLNTDIAWGVAWVALK